MVEEMLAARGISVTRETIRQWGSNSAVNSPIASAGEPDAGVANGNPDEVDWGARRSRVAGWA